VNESIEQALFSVTGFYCLTWALGVTHCPGPPKPANPRISPAKKATSTVSKETERSVIEYDYRTYKILAALGFGTVG